MSSRPDRKEDRLAFVWQLSLRCCGILSLTGYCVWNVFWLVQGRVPPSIFMAVTGLPAPTTGGTRAVLQLVEGNWHESLRYNAMALPLLFLFVLSCNWIVCQAIARKRLSLPLAVFWAWVAALGVAWVLKLTGDPMYW